MSSKGGTHYNSCKLQELDYILQQGLVFYEGEKNAQLLISGINEMFG